MPTVGLPLATWITPVHQTTVFHGNPATRLVSDYPIQATTQSSDVMNALKRTAQRAGSVPSPLKRFLKLVIVAPILLLLYLYIPSKRPYSTDLIVETSDLINAAVATSPSDDHAANDSSRGAQGVPEYAMDCHPDMRALNQLKDKYELDDEIEYLKRYIRFTRKPIERFSRTKLEQNFLPANDAGRSFQVLQLSNNDQPQVQCDAPLELLVPQSRFPADVDLSDFIFAISTTHKRLKEQGMLKEWAYWLSDGNGRSNGGKLILRLLDASDSEIMDVAQQLGDAGIDAEVAAWDSRVEKQMAVRYLNLVPTLVSYDTSLTKKWFVLCDDDTFFPAMNSLVSRFKQYDHTEPLYIGTLSEDVSAVKTHGSQAFGGGGVFLSRPLATTISTIHESCKTRAKVKESNSGWGPQGDILLRKCIYENTDARLTLLKDLWQLDLAGDASGFYEAGLQPYSVHHFKGGQKMHTSYPLETTKIAYTCGEDCPYLRFTTTDNFIISNGYSVAQYPQGINFNLDQLERTFQARGEDKGWNFDFTYGPQRPPLRGTGKKIAWQLRESRHMKDGSVLQVYIRKKDDARWMAKETKHMTMLDSVIELVWVPA